MRDTIPPIPLRPPSRSPPIVRTVHQPLRGLKLGLAKQHFGDGLDAEVAALTEDAIDVYRRLGAEIREVSSGSQSLRDCRLLHHCAE